MYRLFLVLVMAACSTYLIYRAVEYGRNRVYEAQTKRQATATLDEIKQIRANSTHGEYFKRTLLNADPGKSTEGVISDRAMTFLQFNDGICRILGSDIDYVLDDIDYSQGGAGYTEMVWSRLYLHRVDEPQSKIVLVVGLNMPKYDAICKARIPEEE